MYWRVLHATSTMLFTLTCIPVGASVLMAVRIVFDSRVTLDTVEIQQPELAVLALLLIGPLYFLRRYTGNELRKIRTQPARKQRQRK
jgi:hypothetical protein